MTGVYCEGYLTYYGYNTGWTGFRPVVCLKEGITLETLEKGKAKLLPPPPVSAVEVAEEPETYYGACVNYEDPAGDPNVGWKIFHSDGENVYLIADDYIHYDYVPTSRWETKPTGQNYIVYFSDWTSYNGSVDILDASITNPRILKWFEYASVYPTASFTHIKTTAYMLDCEVWEGYNNSLYADYAIGGPPLEMFVESYNSRYPELDIGYSIDVKGYTVGDYGETDGGAILDTSDGTYVISSYERASGLLLASPFDYSGGILDFQGVVRYNGQLVGLGAGSDYYYPNGFRPVICLKSGVNLQANASGGYDLIQPDVVVAEKQAKLEVTEGESNNSFDSLFTVTTKDGGTATKTYTLNGASTSYTNTSDLAVGTHTITCTATYNGVSDSASVVIVVESAGINARTVAAAPETYYGKEIKGYTCTSSAGINKWLIFHSDGTNIYMIADDYVHYDYLPTSENYTLTNENYYLDSDYALSFNNVYKDYEGSVSIKNTSVTDSRILKWITYVNDSNGSSSTEDNIRATAFMLDSIRWSAKFGNSTYADYAIGGPTLEMFVASYNKRYPSLNIVYSTNAYGYIMETGGAIKEDSGWIYLETTDPLYVITSHSKAYACYLASPSGGYDPDGCNDHLVMANWTGWLEGAVCNFNDQFGFRPVVCLKSDVKLTDNGDGTYGLTK